VLSRLPAMSADMSVPVMDRLSAKGFALLIAGAQAAATLQPFKENSSAPLVLAGACDRGRL